MYKITNNFNYDIQTGSPAEFKFINKLLPRFYQEGLSIDIIQQQSFIKNGTHYVVDFYIPSSNLVIEIDSKMHDISNAKIIRDVNADTFFASNWEIPILRILNSEIFDSRSCNRVLDNLVKYIKDNHDSKLDTFTILEALAENAALYCKLNQDKKFICFKFNPNLKLNRHHDIAIFTKSNGSTLWRVNKKKG